MRAKELARAAPDEHIAAASPQRRRALKQRISAISLLGNVAGARLAIDVDELLRLAEEKTGQMLQHPPDGLLFDGLRCLAMSIVRSGNCDAAGQRIARAEIFSWLKSYLDFTRDLSSYPEISHVAVRRPLFITGFGRTGSTFLHRLLSLDDNARTPCLWELWSPSPPPRPESYAGDPRIDLARRRLRYLASVAPSALKIHPMDAGAPDECNWLMRHSTLFVLMYRVPEYWTWLKHLSLAGMRELYAHYLLQVQHLQLFSARGHWLSKSFAHLHYLPVLREVFPDAGLVRLHRHPSRAVPSLCSLAASYRSIYSDYVDFADLGHTVLDLFVDGMSRIIAADGRDEARPVVDVLYEDLLADPVGSVRQIYGQLGYDYTAAFETRMRHYIQQSERRPNPRHVYDLEQFGLSAVRVKAAVEQYLVWLSGRTGRRLAEV